MPSHRPQAFEAFKDFTWYQNTTSRYAFTGLSIPYLLTGVEKPYDINEDDYVDYAYDHSDYENIISDLKYDVAVCTTSSYVRSPLANLVINYQKSEGGKYDSNKLF